GHIRGLNKPPMSASKLRLNSFTREGAVPSETITLPFTSGDGREKTAMDLNFLIKIARKYYESTHIIKKAVFQVDALDARDECWN
ncbi:hypothetical protein ACLOJK_019523, partial [Asimina triloba]